MKVTVCFGTVRVIVPCGNGEIYVSQLIEKASTRYKKAIGRSNDYWLMVHNLKSISDGGILDPDDLLVDVADDREQIIALYEEQDGPPLQHNGGDGTSASSVGTSSPDIFHGNDLTPTNKHLQSHNDVIITPSDLASGPIPNLIVRRGSEPSLNTLGCTTPTVARPEPLISSTNKKRWSSIHQLDQVPDTLSCDTDKQLMPPPLAPPPRNLPKSSVPTHGTAFNRFARDSTRQSLANNDSMFKWLEAQQRHEDRYQISDIRKEPLGGTGLNDDTHTHADEIIAIKNTNGPLGIHVVPHYDNSGRDVGLLVQGIEPDGRIYKDGRLKVNDRITQINGTDLIDVSFSRAQELFKKALQSDEICLKVAKVSAPSVPKTGPPVLAKPTIGQMPSPTKSNGSGQSASPPIPNKRSGLFSPPLSLVKPVNSTAEVVPLSPTKRTPPAVPVRHPSTSLTSNNNGTLPKEKANRITTANTRKIGQKITIILTKDAQGLGFSITTRDNVPGGKSPIYIKNILPKGAAVQDGRLTSGDRLLEVNGEEMTGKSQSEAVATLRSTKLGSDVTLIISRQVQVENSTDEVEKSPVNNNNASKLSSSSTSSSSNLDPSTKQILDLHIELTKYSTAGLGVSVKGKTSTNDRGAQDLGIFIKTIIPDGAASNDGRLAVNDQLIEVNSESLTGLSNAEAMEKLRCAMQRDPQYPNYIDLVVARRRDSTLNMGLLGTPQTPGLSELRVSTSEPPEETVERPASTSGTSENSDQTVIHLQPSTNVTDDVKQTITKLPPSAIPSALQYNFRNDSYMRATHESMSESVLLANSGGRTLSVHQSGGDGLTVHGRQGDANTVMIETDNHLVQMRQGASGKPRPKSSSDVLDGASPQSPSSSRNKANDTAKWIEEWEHNNRSSHDGDVTEDDEHGLGFDREGFGRQSMSEKRKNHLDPKTSAFYQNIKKGNFHNSASWGPHSPALKAWRELKVGKGDTLRRAGSVESLMNASAFRTSILENASSAHTEVGPSLGLKKSSSLESLQTAVHEATQEEEALMSKGAQSSAGGMARGRGCNDSFRAAVDRSYEQPVDNDPMEPLQEESSDNGSVSQGRRSVVESFSTSEATVPPTNYGAQTLGASGAAYDRTSALAPAGSVAEALASDIPMNNKLVKKKSKKEKDKGSLFKGLGSMFRFGKHRDKPYLGGPDADDYDDNKEQTRQRLLQEQQRRLDDNTHLVHPMPQTQPVATPQPKPDATNPYNVSPNTAHNRAERINALRAEHQRRHKERQGRYPHEPEDDPYDLQPEIHPRRPEPVYGDYKPPPRSRQFESHYPDRAGSRKGYLEQGNYSHYANYNEIQQQIRNHDVYQQRYKQLHHTATPQHGPAPTPQHRSAPTPQHGPAPTPQHSRPAATPQHGERPYTQPSSLSATVNTTAVKPHYGHPPVATPSATPMSNSHPYSVQPTPQTARQPEHYIDPQRYTISHDRQGSGSRAHAAILHERQSSESRIRQNQQAYLRQSNSTSQLPYSASSSSIGAATQHHRSHSPSHHLQPTVPQTPQSAGPLDTASYMTPAGQSGYRSQPSSLTHLHQHAGNSVNMQRYGQQYSTSKPSQHGIRSTSTSSTRSQVQGYGSLPRNVSSRQQKQQQHQAMMSGPAQV